MNQGVKILLARMDSHPEEFEDYGPWYWVISEVYDELRGRTGDTPQRVFSRVRFMTDEELTALADKIAKQQGEAFTRGVMTQLLDPPEESITTQAYPAGIYGGGSGNVSIGGVGIVGGIVGGISAAAVSAGVQNQLPKILK